MFWNGLTANVEGLFRDVPRAVWATVVFWSASSSAFAAESTPVDFSRDVQPILSAACFQCHGPDEENREAELRLDTQDGLLASLGDHFAVVAGHPEASEVYQRISSSDPDARMPPEEALSKDEIDVIKRWIEQGAEWSEHWAFVPPTRPELPADLKDSVFVRTPIDAFVWKKLQSESLVPSPEADQTALLRRLSLDLIGLPPTISELDAFIRDSRPDAYERQVDRLLASPHYGEHWGKQWLDAARYADSNGFEKDKPREVWFYRDWVIQSLNDDMPYDQFVVEQIAGDLLPEATQSQHVATGFLRNSMVNEEGGIDPEQFRMEGMFDRMDAIGTSILGLTVRCSQCHSHKFDPLTQEAYYQMFAFLNNCHEAEISVFLPNQARQRDEVLKGIREIERKLQRELPVWPRQMEEWEKTVLAQPRPNWVPVGLEFDDTTASGQKYIAQADGSYLASGYAPEKTQPRVYLKTDLPEIAAIRIEFLLDPDLPCGGPGRSSTGTFAFSEFQAVTSPRDEPSKTTEIKVGLATADLSLTEAPLDKAYNDESGKPRVTGPIGLAIDGDLDSAWSIDIGPGRRNQARKAVFAFAEPIVLSDDTRLSLILSQRHGGSNSSKRQVNSFGRFRISVTTFTHAKADPLPHEVRQILESRAAERTDEQNQRVFRYWRTTVPEWQEANEQIEQLWADYPAGTTQLTVVERANPRTTHRLERGDFLSLGEKVTPNVPVFLHELPGGPPLSRLTFARWLADRKSPTTARAIANRVWQAYFGMGIVRTASDLGTQGAMPSHPQLLDWLAVELMDSGWSLKHLHRLIVTSATYRQSSNVSPELTARDPDNRMLARGPRFRVRAETIRDIALMASGLINLQIGGPSVFPPSPAEIYQPPISYGRKPWFYQQGPDCFRRAMYTFMYRSVPYPPLETFDAPNGDAACVRRSRSNTPLQALTMLNEPLMMQCARALAQKAVQEPSRSDEERLATVFRKCVARRPSSQESQVLLDMLHKNNEHFSQLEPEKSWELAADDPAHPPELPPDVTPAQVASWTAVTRILLNLDETISKE